MRPSSREKPRYLLISELLGVLIRLSAGRLMLSALGLEEEQEAAGFDDEEEGTAAAAAAAADPRPWPGPVELVVLQSPTGAVDDVLSARETALTYGLLAGMAEGCTAAMLVEVKALLSFDHLWQALATGIALARSNAITAAAAAAAATGPGASYPAAPVQVVVTDTKDWMFFTIEAVGAATIGGGNGGHAGGAAGHGTAGGGGGGGVATGIDFTTSNGETFRMSNCSVLQTTGLFKPTPDTGNLIQLMYRLFTGLYPGMVISSLPAAVREAEERTRQAADGWLKEMKDSLSRAEALRRRVQ
ncbi:hypothetical protein CHLRE_09g400700v5 [Chlamydomonas reinhardtii]|uniref:Uncharacterized protein n=1 Tax=Chlamydomonas reinhardtii TaxID=3055 RepID=A0A2K3DCU2_CHLRE|nr:uncharacterized protein CHLRE_09g400700v5 [Chlamydomonas reinhardtii]PNW78352.1 hypothetical protein CHLRE_09g400700v5 [Chlamydomonas reinhardtii]